ncbi:hypothetical protein, partial [Kosakonia sp. YIM B13587]|uniref:hypothetical protein n=1 Tax=Kosakonia sp. YIM B13587 TaxID=3366288 RepID=UPI00367D2768
DQVVRVFLSLHTKGTPSHLKQIQLIAINALINLCSGSCQRGNKDTTSLKTASASHHNPRGCAHITTTVSPANRLFNKQVQVMRI